MLISWVIKNHVQSINQSIMLIQTVGRSIAEYYGDRSYSFSFSFVIKNLKNNIKNFPTALIRFNTFMYGDNIVCSGEDGAVIYSMFYVYFMFLSYLLFLFKFFVTMFWSWWLILIFIDMHMFTESSLINQSKNTGKIVIFPMLHTQ